MSGTTLTSAINVGIVLGIDPWLSPFTIAATGGIAPSGEAATGVNAGDPAGYVRNDGSIAGGVGGAGQLGGYAPPGTPLIVYPGGNGGLGVALGTGSLTNAGTVSGGAGGPGFPSVVVGHRYGWSYGGAGGIGVTVGAGGGVTNYGRIVGGAGGITRHDSSPDGPGGAGVYLNGGGMLTNHGVILGGAGGPPWGIGWAGAGVMVHGGTVDNFGFIGGGYGPAVSLAGLGSRLILHPEATVSGTVDGIYPDNVLELATGNGTGTITGLGGAIRGFGTIQFDPGASWLVAEDLALISNQPAFQGFDLGDTIQLSGFVETGFEFTGAGLVLSSESGARTIGLTGSFTTSDFAVSTIDGDTVIEIACFAAGTRIGTPRGEIAVEALRIGDSVSLAEDDEALPVVWLGHRTVDCTRHGNPAEIWPVRVRSGAFGPGRPHRDLLLSPDHAIFAAGVLVPIKYLINGGGIAQVRVDAVTYHHVELSRHAVLLAEGLPAESYLDVGDRLKFANVTDRAVRSANNPACVWEAAACAPLIVAGPKLAAVRAIVERWRYHAAPPPLAPDTHASAPTPHPD